MKKELDSVLTAQPRREDFRQASGQKPGTEFCIELLSAQDLTRDPEPQRQFMQLAMRESEARQYRVLLFQTDPDATPAQRARIFALLRLEIGARAYLPFFFQNDREYVLVVFFPPTENSLYSMKNCAARVLSRLPDLIGLRGCAAISRLHRTWDEVPGGYQEAVCAINQRLLRGWGKAFAYEEEVAKTRFSFSREDSALWDALRHMNGADSGKAFEKILRDPGLRAQGSSYDLHEQVVNILGVLMRYYGRSRTGRTGADDVQMLLSERHDLYRFRHMDELEAYLQRVFSAICRTTKRESDGEDIIRSILDDIERNYQEEITMQGLAEKYFMNASYLSRLFKARCGKTFSKYLIGYRLEKSRELLEKTAFKISDVAALVGYNDLSHYIHSFRKLYGVTPEQYRKTLGKDRD